MQADPGHADKIHRTADVEPHHDARVQPRTGESARSQDQDPAEGGCAYRTLGLVVLRKKSNRASRCNSLQPIFMMQGCIEVR
jgi:hypothetical protein